MTLPSPRLHDGVVFVDTPGVGSLATAGAAETIAYLPRCDHGVLLVDATAPLTADDVGTLDRLVEAGIPATVLLSKADLLSASDLDRRRGRAVAGELGGPPHDDRRVAPRGRNGRLREIVVEAAERRNQGGRHGGLAHVAVERSHQGRNGAPVAPGRENPRRAHHRLPVRVLERADELFGIGARVKLNQVGAAPRAALSVERDRPPAALAQCRHRLLPSGRALTV